MSLLWRGCTTRGVVVGGAAGLVLALGLTIMSPAIWVAVFGADRPIFPYGSPALFSMPAAFVTIWIASLVDRSRRSIVDRDGYLAQRVRPEAGLGAAKASTH